MNKKIILTALGLSVILVGCQSPNVNNTQANNQNNQNNVTENTETENITNENPSEDREDEDKGVVSTDIKLIEASDVTLEDLQTAFKDEFPAGEITSVSIDNEDREVLFDVEGIEDGKEVQVEIDALTKEVVKSEKDDEVEDDVSEVLNLTELKDWKEAVQAAMDAEKTEDFKELELKVKDGKAVYEIELPNVDGDIVLDAKTLEVIK